MRSGAGGRNPSPNPSPSPSPSPPFFASWSRPSVFGNACAPLSGLVFGVAAGVGRPVTVTNGVEFEFEFAFGLEAPLGCDPKLEPKLPKLGNAPVCIGCCCCACCGCCPEGFALFGLPKPIANSMSVGGLGTGGAGATGCPNGFLEPVWCVLTGWAGGGEADGDGADVSCGDESSPPDPELSTSATLLHAVQHPRLRLRCIHAWPTLCV